MLPAMNPPAPYFDPALARGPTRVLPVSAVIDMLEVEHAPEHVERYRQAMASGARFPPVAVVRLAGRYFLADGHKRFCAARRLGACDAIVVEIWSISRWAEDQWGQLRRKTALQLALLRRATRDPAARAEARALFAHFATHWGRIGRSVGEKLRRRRAGPGGAA